MDFIYFKALNNGDQVWKTKIFIIQIGYIVFPLYNENVFQKYVGIN